MGIIIDQISKSFGTFKAVNGASFEVPTGSLVALLGPSGSGKSSLLRIVAGLEQADEGSVVLDGERIDYVDARKRGVGFVFQHYALFRHMSVEENVEFGLRVRGIDKAARQKKAKELLLLLGLDGLGHRYPEQLSGGQRQRVALARALAPKPRVLLLDEPFAAVDAKVRGELQRWLRKMHDELRVTSLFVTHDQEEAFTIADVVVIMNQGRIEQVGSAQDVIDHPKSEFVARFIGEVNVVEIVVNAEHHAGGSFLGVSVLDFSVGTRVRLVSRSHEIAIWPNPEGPGTIKRVVRFGERTKINVSISNADDLLVSLPEEYVQHKGLKVGQKVDVKLQHPRIYPA